MDGQRHVFYGFFSVVRCPPKKKKRHRFTREKPSGGLSCWYPPNFDNVTSCVCRKLLFLHFHSSHSLGSQKIFSMIFNVPPKNPRTSEFFGGAFFGDFDMFVVVGSQTLALANLQDHLRISDSKMSLVRNVIDTDGTLFIKVTVHPR